MLKSYISDRQYFPHGLYSSCNIDQLPPYVLANIAQWENALWIESIELLIIDS